MNQGPASAVEDRVSESLTSAIDLYGPALLRDPQRLKARLEAACPGATREIAALVAAIAAHVPQTMMAADAVDDASLGLPALVDRLMKQASLDRRQARWVVRTWARAMAVSARGLDDDTLAARGAGAANPHSSIAEVLGFGARDVSQGPPSAPAGVPARRRMNEPVHEPIAVRTAREASVPAAGDRLVAAPAARFAAAPGDHESAGHGVAVPALADELVGGRSGPPGIRRQATPVERRDPTPLPLGSVIEPVDEAPVAAPVEPRADAPRVPAVERTDAVPAAPDDAVVPSSSEQAGAAVATTAAPEVIHAATATVPQVEHATPATARAVEHADAATPPEIGHARPASPPAVEAVVPTSGGAVVASASRPAVAAAAADAAPAQGAVATHDETKLPRDDTQAAARSAAPSAGPAAARRVPRVAIVVGLVIAVAIVAAWSLRSSGRRAVDLTAPIAATSTAPASSRPAADKPPATQAAGAADGLEAPRAPAVAPARAPAPESASTSTLSSPPADAPSLPATAAPPKAAGRPTPAAASRTTATVERRAPSAAPKRVPAAAVDEHPGVRRPAACTRTDCGSVVASRPVPGDPRNFEMTIRMDDRSIHTLVQPLPLRPGTRMRMTNNRFVPAAAS